MKTPNVLPPPPDAGVDIIVLDPAILMLELFRPQPEVPVYRPDIEIKPYVPKAA